MIQQPLLDRQPAREAREGALASDHPVAGHEKGQGISSRRRAHRPGGVRTSDGPGDFSVGPRFSPRYLEDRHPDRLLESGAVGRQAEIRADPRRCPLEIGIDKGRRRGKQAGVIGPPIGKRHGLGASRTRQPCHLQAIAVAGQEDGADGCRNLGVSHGKVNHLKLKP